MTFAEIVARVREELGLPPEETEKHAIESLEPYWSETALKAALAHAIAKRLMKEGRSP